MRLCTEEAGDRSYYRNLRVVIVVSTCREQRRLCWLGEMDSVGHTHLVEEREEGDESWGKDCVFLLTPNMNDLSHLKIKTPCIHCSPNYTLDFHTTIENAFQNMIWLVNSILLATISLPLVTSLSWRI